MAARSEKVSKKKFGGRRCFYGLSMGSLQAWALREARSLMILAAEVGNLNVDPIKENT